MNVKADPLLALICGGVLGAMQCTVLSGLLPESFTVSHHLDMAGWILATVPIGALIGTAVSALIVRLHLSRKGLSSFLLAWGTAIICGFTPSLTAPLLLVGAGPDDQRYRHIAFIFEYGMAWIAMFLIFKPRREKR